jgi:tyrosyl-DNA phosphodiesterase-1
MQHEPRDGPPTKRRRLSVDLPKEEILKTQPQTNPRRGHNRPISPPLPRRACPDLTVPLTPTWSFDNLPKQKPVSPTAKAPIKESKEAVEDENSNTETRVIPSPVQLTRIEKLPKEQNVDAVGLTDLLGDPLIKECWNFNFLFDLDFVMQVLPGGLSSQHENIDGVSC